MRYANGHGDFIEGGSVDNNIHFDPWLGLYLYEGWNIVTAAFVDEGMETAADLGAWIPGCTVVAMWDMSAQKYVSHVVGITGDFALDNGSAYFVFVTQDVNVQYIGGLRYPQINMTLNVGYNLIGWPYPWVENASWMAERIDHCIKIAPWDAENQAWLPEYITALDDVDFDLLMGQGVFVFVNQESQWRPPT